MPGKLIIARHHESEWNKLGKWTGTRDRHLTEYGFEKSVEMGSLMKGIPVDNAFASMQVRSIETLSCMLNALELYRVPTEHSLALNERDYGDYTGKNKWEMEKILGEEEHRRLRRGWDYPIPNGETLKMVFDRAVPYFLGHILPLVSAGKNVLVVAHGNSLRAVIKYIENLSDEEIADVEMPFGAVIVYDLDAEGHMVSKETRQVTSNVHA
jgi:2,3-bisphosphoglycerate-dependent phosphoglycerate mutase